jgi:SAM-dependent methyltransferase
VIPGTQGYAENAATLIAQYEALAFPVKHEAVMHLLPTSPVAALDVGAGTGADAHWLAEQGHRVIAVEPTDAFRKFAAAHHPSPRITWVDDGLPHLASLDPSLQRFGLIMVTAVWMHLSTPERAVGMPVLARLLAPGGVLVMALRHGPRPPGRRMFEVSAHETVGLAEHSGLRCVLDVATESLQAENRRAGVTWSRLAFTR